MSEQTDSTTAVHTAQAAFDHARDVFLAAFAMVPDEALSYLPAGDEYVLGALPVHLPGAMINYMDVLDRIEAATYGQVDLSADTNRRAQEVARHQQVVDARPTAADRAATLQTLGEAHQRVQTRLGALDDATFERQAPVIYSAGTEPYPTAVRDIMGWLTDHYDEHTAQVGQLLAQWRAEPRS